MLVDSGASKNYIKPLHILPQVVPVNNKFCINSIHGSNQITDKCWFRIFGIKSSFFLLPQLSTFDGIVGLDLLKRVDGIISLKHSQLITNEGTEVLNYMECSDVNLVYVNKPNVPEGVKDKFDELINRRITVFADPNEALPYNTKVVATIRTVDDEPVYSKLYPYPPGVTDFVNKEIKTLLEQGIIQPSRSPYNNPIWVVDKKGVDEEGYKNKRLVIDFRKLNLKTIEDKYPIPCIPSILCKFKDGKFFSTVDLKSGFHQLLLSPKDREKTAFSVNNGKYEFCRLAFGLKNAPSIFQRAMDDVLREGVGKFLDFYMDDIIIFSENEEDHIKHIEWVLDKLSAANMKVNITKSFFFKTSVEYLGFVVSKDGIRTCPDKVEAITNFPQPVNLFQVRSFLGMAGYYRQFITDFASIAKPLTDILKGENGSVSAQRSKKVPVDFTSEQLASFNKLRLVLASDDVILHYPDFTKPFDLTTDASSSGLGAVLSQNKRPITMISRTLKDPEMDYATNERELLAIVWAIKRLRSYLYGVRHLKIFSDHQPLIFSISDKNTNAKLKRWKAFVEEHNGKIFYKPGKENVVADALSRQAINLLEGVSTAATVHSEESLSFVIRRTEIPLNCYMNQILIEESDFPSVRTFVLFRNKRRHIVRFSDPNNLFDQIKDIVNDRAVNAIHCDLTVLARIQNRLVETFPSTKFWHAPKLVMDVSNSDEQRDIITTEHLRAHRGVQNVTETVLRDYYFPKMGKVAAEIIANCSICKQSKYERHPSKQCFGKTPIPSRPGERIHIDIFSTDGKHYLTSVDKFSKFAIVQLIASRSTVDVTPAILEIVNYYPDIAHIYCDNEGSFNSVSMVNLLSRFNIEISSCAPQHSTSNGQVERFHSTLAEIARCLKEERQIVDTTELLLLATIEYNKTIHSVTNEKPNFAFHSSSALTRGEIKARLIGAQSQQLRRFNKNRKNRVFDVGARVLVKLNKRLGNKLSPRYAKRRVQADLGSTALIGGQIVHKDNIR